MKNIYKVLIGVAVTATLLVAMDWAVGTWSEKMYYKSKYGIFHRQIYCLQESKDDIMILGSSRAAHHYVPQVLKDSLGMSCYNAGSDGECIFYHFTLLASMIERGHTPKVVIYDFHPCDIEIYSGATFSLDAALDNLMPHYGESASIDSLFALKGWKERVKQLSKSYKYNSKLVQTIKCNYIPSEEDRGYEALIGCNVKENDLIIHSNSSDEIVIDKDKVEYLSKLICLCKKNNIKLLFVYSPMFESSSPKVVELAKKITTENEIAFIDYGEHHEFCKADLYYDTNHLNDQGARMFTKDIVKVLMKE